MSCKGEDGAIGPVGTTGMDGIDGRDGVDGTDGTDGADGAVGPVGPVGEKGEKGAKGNKGDDGNANVISSDWALLDWNTSITADGFSFSDPAITTEVTENALVLGFVRTQGSSTVYGLPIFWFSGEYHIQYLVREGEFRVYYRTLITPIGTPTLEARYVIIPPDGRLAAENNDPKGAIMEELVDAGVDINDYQQVSKYLSLRP